MKKDDFKAILKKCFGKERDDRLHSIAMLVIYGFFILILIIFIRLSPTSSSLNNDNTNSNSTPKPTATNKTQEDIDINETFDVNYSYIYTINYNGVKEIITGKKLDDKEIFTIIDTKGSNDYAILSNNYLKKENGEYHIIESPTTNLIYTDIEKIIELVGVSSSQGTYNIPSYRIVNAYYPNKDVSSLDKSLTDTITITVENNLLRKIDLNFSNYASFISGTSSTLTINMEFSNVGTTENFNVTISE